MMCIYVRIRKITGWMLRLFGCGHQRPFAIVLTMSNNVVCGQGEHATSCSPQSSVVLGVSCDILVL